MRPSCCGCVKGAAGVDVTAVRYSNLIHDGELLNPLSHLPAVRDSLQQAGAMLRKHLT